MTWIVRVEEPIPPPEPGAVAAAKALGWGTPSSTAVRKRVDATSALYHWRRPSAEVLPGFACQAVEIAYSEAT